MYRPPCNERKISLVFLVTSAVGSALIGLGVLSLSGQILCAVASVLLYLVIVGFFYLAFRRIAKQSNYMQQLNRELLLVSDHERAKMSHYLHDGLGQMLSGANLMMARLRRQLKDQEDSKKLLQELSEVIRQALLETRNLSRSSGVTSQFERRLETCLQTLIGNTRSLLLVDIHTDIDWSLVATLSLPESHELYFIILEAVNNATRHGGAQQIRIRIAREPKRLLVEIQDDGTGLKTPLVEEKDPGMGSRIMQYRSEKIGWEFSMCSEAKGVKVQVYKKQESL